MNLFDNTELGLQAAIRGAGMRQTVLSQNIANANTPGYQRKDVDFQSALDQAMGAGMSPDQVQFSVSTDASAPMQADGNSVDIDTESAKLAENGADVRVAREHRQGPARHHQRRDRERRLMGLFDALDVSGSGLSAERLRMDVTAENLANAQTTPGRERPAVPAQGGRAAGDRRRRLRRGAGRRDGHGARGARRPAACRSPASWRTRRPAKQVYDPGHPDANAQGYVSMPNVDPVTEMVDLITASRSYEANVTAMQTAKSMFSKTLDLLR